MIWLRLKENVLHLHKYITANLQVTDELLVCAQFCFAQNNKQTYKIKGVDSKLSI